MKAAWFGLSVFLVLSCGDSGEEPPPPSTTVQFEELCSVLAKAECDRLSTCGVLTGPLNVSACLVRQNDVQCGLLETEARRLIALGEIEFDPEAAARCRDEISAAGCTEGLRTSALVGPDCGSIWRARTGADMPCSSSLSCTSGLVCLVTDQCPGACQRPASTNEACGTTSVCDDANFCSLAALRCRQRVARDQPCEGALSGSACEEGSWCDEGQLGGGRCAAAGGRGFACADSYQCAARARCIRGRCSAGLEDDGCASPLDCLDDRLCAAGRCRTPIAVGETCVPAEQACSEGATCKGEEGAETCQARGAPAASCEDASDCYLGRCKGGRCLAYAADGSECESTADCRPGRVCDMAVCRVVDACFL